MLNESYFFIKNKSRNLVNDFLKSMNKYIYKKTINQMKLLEIYGINTNCVSIKKFQNDIWKIRAKDASNNVRVYFYMIENKIYYLYAFYKSTQKTPENKKIVINNLKKELLISLKKRDFELYLEKIDFNLLEQK